MKNSEGIPKHKPSIDEMWQFIDNIMQPNKLVPDKTILTYEQIFPIYSKLVEIDELFKDIVQIKILQTELYEEKAKKSR